MGRSGDQILRRLRGTAGFSLLEVVTSLFVLGLVMLAVSAVSLTGLVRLSDRSLERQSDATSAQWLSVKFARDVQGASDVVAECQPASGTHLLTLRMSDGTPSVEYRAVTAPDGTFSVHRVVCGGASSKVVDGLEDLPTLACDGAPCYPISDPRPDVVRLDVDRSAEFQFELDGARRTTEISGDPITEAPDFMSVGGSGAGNDDPLNVSGHSTLVIRGSALINGPDSGTVAVQINGSARLSVDGLFEIEQGATCTNCTARANKVPGQFSTRIPDPLRFLPVPQGVAPSATNDECPVQGVGDQAVRVCKPGRYTNEFPPGQGSTKNFELEPGIYVMAAGIRATGGNGGGPNSVGPSLVSRPGGVLIYNEAGRITINGGYLNLAPPDSGVYRGILIFQARSNTERISISGNADAGDGTCEVSDDDPDDRVVGAIYAPGSDGVALGAGGGELCVGRVIGSSLSTSGNGRVIVGVG